MKKIFTISAFMLAAVFMGCNSPEEKVEKAKENVEEANAKLDKAQKELEQHQAEVEKYRQAIVEQVAANRQRIVELRGAVDKAQKGTKEVLTTQINELEERNDAMEKRLIEFNEVGKEQWENFKVEFNRDMDDLGQALRDFSVKNVK
jgi:outer membrane murein-binding lipoprotein Lpp